MKVDFDTLILMADFKDIDYIYYLLRRYQQVIEPALSKMNGTDDNDNDNDNDKRSDLS